LRAADKKRAGTATLQRGANKRTRHAGAWRSQKKKPGRLARALTVGNQAYMITNCHQRERTSLPGSIQKVETFALRTFPPF